MYTLNFDERNKCSFHCNIVDTYKINIVLYVMIGYIEDFTSQPPIRGQMLIVQTFIPFRGPSSVADGLVDLRILKMEGGLQC